MAPAKIDEAWEVRLAEAAEEYPAAGASRLHRELLKIETEDGLDDCPSRKWVDRRLRAHRALPENDKAQFRQFSWPASMETGSLPWEASRVALDVLRNRLYAYKTRPTIGAVRWHWRISLAVPHADFNMRESLLTAIGRGRDRNPHERFDDGKLDRVLAFEPWRSDLHRHMFNETFPDSPWEGNHDDEES